MKELEKKILKKVYFYETRHTLVEIILEALGLGFLILAVVIFGQVITDILIEQKTLDLFSLFGENFEVIKKYFFDTVFIFYTEIPKLFLIIFLIFIGLLIFLVLSIMKNFPKLKNKLSSLLKFYRGI